MVYREIGARECLKLNNSVGIPGWLGEGGSLSNDVLIDGNLDVRTLEFTSIDCQFSRYSRTNMKMMIFMLPSS